MSKKSCNSFGSQFLWIRGKKKYQYDVSNNEALHLDDPELIKSDDIMDESIGLTSSLNAVEGAAPNISSHSVHANEQLNGITPTKPIDLEIDHDDHNTSTLLATGKRNGIREKTNMVDVNLNRAKSYSGDDLSNRQSDNVQHGSPLDSIECFDDDNSDDVDSTKLNYLNLPKARYLKLPQVPFSSTVEDIIEENDTVADNDTVDDNDTVGDKTVEDTTGLSKCEECCISCLYYSLMCCECTIS